MQILLKSLPGLLFFFRLFFPLPLQPLCTDVEYLFPFMPIIPVIPASGLPLRVHCYATCSAKELLEVVLIVRGIGDDLVGVIFDVPTNS